MAPRLSESFRWSTLVGLGLVVSIGASIQAIHPAQAEIKLAQLFSKSKKTSEMQLRIDRLEGQIRTMTGQIEELNHQIRLMDERIRRMQEDNEFRFQQLEGGTETKKRTRSKDELPTVATTEVPGPSASDAMDPLGKKLGEDPATGSRMGGLPLDLSAVAKAPPPKAEATLTPPRDIPEHPRDAYDQAYDIFLSGNYESSEAHFRGFLETFPDHQLAADAQFWVGESLYARGKYRGAADAFFEELYRLPGQPKGGRQPFEVGHRACRDGAIRCRLRDL